MKSRNKAELPADPLDLFQRWFDQAQSMAQPMPEAMTLATCDGEGRPDARMVLLKGAGRDGFVFFTNYESAKAGQLDSNPAAALVFWWESIRKQVRVVGAVQRLDPAASDAYFQSRMRDSQMGAWASPQSQVIPSRAYLEERFESVGQRFPEADVPRPPFWGGYRLLPRRLEFWREFPHRLHDRFAYSLSDGAWSIERLAP